MKKLADDDTNDDMANWVQNSRKAEAKRKRDAELLSAVDDFGLDGMVKRESKPSHRGRNDYSSKDLKVGVVPVFCV